MMRRIIRSAFLITYAGAGFAAAATDACHEQRPASPAPSTQSEPASTQNPTKPSPESVDSRLGPIMAWQGTCPLGFIRVELWQCQHTDATHRLIIRCPQLERVSIQEGTLVKLPEELRSSAAEQIFVLSPADLTRQVHHRSVSAAFAADGTLSLYMADFYDWPKPVLLKPAL